MDKTIIFYGTPAYGHINPTLPIVSELVKEGFRVVYYATKEFEDAILMCGAEFREYDFAGIDWQPEVGSRILKLTELVLRFTHKQQNLLIDEVKELKPVLIMHDTIALWGRVVAEKMGIKAISVNTIITIYPYTSKTFRMYLSRFMLKSIADISALPGIIKFHKAVKGNMIQILMNQEQFNIFTYPQRMHPDGERMNEGCFFLGPSSILRVSEGTESEYNNLIYISLGTIFNNSMNFYRRIMAEFGDSEYTVVVSCGKYSEALTKENTAKNIHFRSFVNQSAIMKQAKLFITAGGMNSLCEAVSNNVPCLMYPMQGEQYINCKNIEKLRLGKMLKTNKAILPQAKELINLGKISAEDFTNIKMSELIERIYKYIEASEA